MTDEIKTKIIKDSLIFYLILEYFSNRPEDFEKYKEIIIQQIKEKLDSFDLPIDELILKTKAKNHAILDIVLTFAFDQIIKKEYSLHSRQGMSNKLRKEVLDRDRYTCQYCGVNLKESIENPFPPTVDHVISMRAGGKNVPENLVACCWKCNLGKKDYDEFREE